jgi:hypothetical protein
MKRSSGIGDSAPFVVYENSVVAAITEEGAAEFSDSRRVADKPGDFSKLSSCPSSDQNPEV